MTETFEMVPASAKAMWLLGGISLFLIALLVLFGFLAYSTRNAKFEVTTDGLRIRGDLYGRFIPASHLVLEEAEHLNLRHKGPYRPTWRKMGTGLPGYLSGWFKLKNGEKGLLYVTDHSRVVKLPTRDGYTLLLSVEDPHRFLEALKRLERG
jgi:hypothetical protein